MYGATAVVGNVAVVTMGGSAWCRFATENRRSMVAQAVACPIFIFLAFATGIIVTSASTQVLGVAYWQPFELMRCKNHPALVSLCLDERCGSSDTYLSRHTSTL